jgi:hypothetical protein
LDQHISLRFTFLPSLFLPPLLLSPGLPIHCPSLALDANKAVGPDIISNKMLIAVKVQISKPLCMLFNKSLHQNIFPTDWKLSHVIPLFKVGDKSFPSNYRPVSLLSCVSKLLEKIVLNISLIIYREINYCVNFSQVFYQVDLLPINL